MQATTSSTERWVVVSVTGSPASGSFWKYAQALRSTGPDRTTANFFISLLAFHSADGWVRRPQRAPPRGVGRKSGDHYIGAARLADSRPHVACLGNWSVEVLKGVEPREPRD
jgi:hypothetical protein